MYICHIIVYTCLIMLKEAGRADTSNRFWTQAKRKPRVELQTGLGFMKRNGLANGSVSNSSVAVSFMEENLEGDLLVIKTLTTHL